jgi:hypothetical protein
MKYLVEGTCDFIIKARGTANVNPNSEKKDEADWVDKEAGLANGRWMPDSVIFHAPVHDEYGNIRGYNRVYLTISDIQMMAQKIKELETTECIVTVSDDLPF